MAKKKFKILAASDIHGDTRLVKKLANKAKKENADLVVLCGDNTGWTETKNLIKPFKDNDKPVLIIPGNWDSFATVDFLASLYNIRNIHGYSVTYEGIGFLWGGRCRRPRPRRSNRQRNYEIPRTGTCWIKRN